MRNFTLLLTILSLALLLQNCGVNKKNTSKTITSINYFLDDNLLEENPWLVNPDGHAHALNCKFEIVYSVFPGYIECGEFCTPLDEFVNSQIFIKTSGDSVPVRLNESFTSLSPNYYLNRLFANCETKCWYKPLIVKCNNACNDPDNVFCKDEFGNIVDQPLNADVVSITWTPCGGLSSCGEIKLPSDDK